jgi:hypothetical protein
MDRPRSARTVHSSPPIVNSEGRTQSNAAMNFQAVGVTAARTPAGASTTPLEPRQSWMERVLDGATRGVLGAMATTGMRRLSTGLGLVEKTPPREMAEDVLLFLGALSRLPADRRDAAIEFVHWSYGAVGGIGYAVPGTDPHESLERYGVRTRKLGVV